MSAGIRSGVNWMRFQFSPITVPRVSTSRVLPSPGRPTSSACPPDSSAISDRSTTLSWPMKRGAMAARAVARRSPRASMAGIRLSDMGALRLTRAVRKLYGMSDAFAQPAREESMADEANVTDAAGRLALEARRAAKSGGLPPVHLWNPPFCGDLDIVIKRDGTWFYLGTPIGRAGLVRLFSTILKREGERYFLVTPVEKVGITVEDAPFVAVDVEAEGGDLVFETNVGDRAAAGPDHPIRVVLDPATGEPAPYIHIRAGLEARIDRKTFYRLVDLGEVAQVAGVDWFGVRSGGRFWPMIRAAELG